MVFDHVEFDDHEAVTFLSDEAIGLRAVHAFHRTRDGSAGGGVRFRPYPTDAEAVTDVLRLSKAMTYKMVLADLPMGGAKTVIIGDPATDRTPDLFRAVGRFIASLDGRYLAGPDVGTGSPDMDLIGEMTEHVVGRSDGIGSTGIPTALGVFEGIRAISAVVFGDPSVDGRSVAVQGVGGVGEELALLLTEAGANVMVADLDDEAVDKLVARYGVESCVPDAILAADVDIVSPNAIGAVLSPSTIPTIRAKAVCGAANNQLADPEDGRLLADRGIVWAPDYVVSAGGAIAGAAASGRISVEARDRKIAAIFDTTVEVIEAAIASVRPTAEVALEIAAERMCADGETE